MEEVNPLYTSFRIPPREKWFGNLQPLKCYRRKERAEYKIGRDTKKKDIEKKRKER